MNLAMTGGAGEGAAAQRAETSARELTVKWAPWARPGGVSAVQTAIVYMPARLAAVTPAGESSNTTHRAGWARSWRAATR